MDHSQQAVETLVLINEEISAAEDRGDARALDGLLAPTLAFRRANGQVVGRDEFLAQLQTGGPRKTLTRSILLLGRGFSSSGVRMIAITDLR